MEYGLSDPSQQGIGEARSRNAPGLSFDALPQNDIQWALVRGAGELRELERRIQRIQASTERVLASSRGLVPAYSPLAAEIAEAAEEAQWAQRQIGSARALLESTAGPVGSAGAFSATGAAAALTPGVRGTGPQGVLIRQPVLEIRDNGKEFHVRAELPGMTKEDIDVQATESGLHVVAHQEDEAVEDGQLVSTERLANRFERTVPLPDYVVPSKAVAAFRDGILEITLPKRHPGEPAQRLTLK